MKKIVNDLLYDTSLATEIYRDEKTMRIYYKTENSNYFCLYPNNSIVPMTETSIKTLLGDVDIDKYIELFSTPEYA